MFRNINVSINFSENKLQVVPEIDEDWLSSLSCNSSSQSDLIKEGMYFLKSVVYMYI